jgi:hypothetical protein
MFRVPAITFSDVERLLVEFAILANTAKSVYQFLDFKFRKWDALVKAQAEVGWLSRENIALQNRIVQLRAECKVADTEARLAEQEVARLTERVDGQTKLLKAQAKRNSVEVGRISQENIALQSRIDQLCAAHKAADTEARAAEQEVARLTERVDGQTKLLEAQADRNRVVGTQPDEFSKRKLPTIETQRASALVQSARSEKHWARRRSTRAGTHEG